jgi:hypothetical protein
VEYKDTDDGKLRIELLRKLDEAEQKAWASLAHYKFMMFGYWAAVWVHLNRVTGTGSIRHNPWARLVAFARDQRFPLEQKPTSEQCPACLYTPCRCAEINRNESGYGE